MQADWVIRIRLLALMFLEYFVWGAWSVQIGSYMNGTLGFSGSQVGWIYAASALGALVSPVFVGYFADRYFATERIFGVLHLAGAVCLFLAARQSTFPALMTVIVVQALCFMPTLPLANNLVFRNIDNPDKFSRVVVGGTVGWILAGLAVGFLLHEATAAFFNFAAAAEIVLVLYSVTLPHTPPAGRKQSQDVLGLSAAKLLKEPAFLVFALAIPLATISATFYTTWANAFLSEIRLPRPTALMTLSQASGVIVLILLPWFIAKMGMKLVLVTGMLVYALRYLLFAHMTMPAILAGLLLHGFSYDFVIIGASIYAARLVPPVMSARAQSFIALLTFGIGTFAGARVAGMAGHWYAPHSIVAAQRTALGGEQFRRVPLPDWQPQGSASLPQVLGAPDDRVKLSMIENLPESGITIERNGSLRYAKESLLAAFREADHDRDGIVTSLDWQRAQRHAWPWVWGWGIAWALLAFLLFWFGGREPKRVTE